MTASILDYMVIDMVDFLEQSENGDKKAVIELENVGLFLSNITHYFLSPLWNDDKKQCCPDKFVKTVFESVMKNIVSD